MTTAGSKSIIKPAGAGAKPGSARKGWIAFAIAMTLIILALIWAGSSIFSNRHQPAASPDVSLQRSATSPELIEGMPRTRPGAIKEIADVQSGAASAPVKSSAASNPSYERAAAGTTSTTLASPAMAASAAKSAASRPAQRDIDERALAEAERKLQQVGAGAPHLDETAQSASVAPAANPPTPGALPLPGDPREIYKAAGGPADALQARMSMIQSLIGQAAQGLPGAAGRPAAPAAGVEQPTTSVAAGPRGANMAGVSPGIASYERFAGQTSAPEGIESAAVPAIMAARRPEGLAIREGSVIPVVTLEAAKSDIPGTVRSQVTRNVYDTTTSRHLLIPMGTMFIGRYMAEVGVAQDELPVIFYRMDMPDGQTFLLPGFEALGPDGRAGIPADANNHYIRRYGTGLLLGFLADRVVRPSAIPGGLNGGMSATGQIIADTARSDLNRMGSAPRTLEVPYGREANIRVKKDMIFPSAYQGRTFR